MLAVWWRRVAFGGESEGPVERLDGPDLAIAPDVRSIEIGGDRDAGVSHLILDQPEVRAGRQHGHGVGVPERVRLSVREPGLLK